MDDTGREREHHRLVYGADAQGRRTATASSAGTARRRVGPVRDADPHRGRRHRAVRRPRRRRHRHREGRRGHGPLAQDRHRVARGGSPPAHHDHRSRDGRAAEAPEHAISTRATCLPVGANIVAQEGEHIDARRGPSPRSRATRPRCRTSPAVCPASPSCSRPASRRITPSSARSTAWCRSARTPRASARSSSRRIAHRRRRRITDQAREYLIPKGKHIQVQPGDHVRAGDPLQDGPAEPARHLAREGREGARGLARERNPAGLPPAGRRHQRQAHRGRSSGRCSGACASRRSVTRTS